jgi:hypothetical protein
LQERRKRLSEDIFQRLRDGFGFIADRHADAPRPVIQGQDSHLPGVLQQTPGVASGFAGAVAPGPGRKRLILSRGMPNMQA